MLILDGKATAAAIRAEIAAEVAEARQKGIRAPGLAVIRVGDDPASIIYVRNKRRACEEVGIESFLLPLPAEAPPDLLLSIIEDLNKAEGVDGILLQLPLPAGLPADNFLMAISPEKDVDGFHPHNVGKMALGLPAFMPCTPAGVLELLKRAGFSLAGKKAVVVGRSNIVGRPLARLLSSPAVNATVTLCHSATTDLAEHCRSADFLFLAMGRANAITGDMVKEGCVVVDIGINRQGKTLTGDAEFESVSKKAAAITPVPGGIGPMTIAMLLRNTLAAWRARLGLENEMP